MTSKGYQPIVILTKPDLVPEANISGKLEAIFDTGIIDSHIQEFSSRTKIPTSNIFPVMNYTGQYSKQEWVREKLALNAFNAALKVANTKIANDLKKFIIVKDVKGNIIGTASFDGASETPLSVIREQILQGNPTLKNFTFVNQQKIEISVDGEEQIFLTRVAKSDNTFSFWTVKIIPHAVVNVPQVPIGIDLTVQVPEALTISKDGEDVGVVPVSPDHVTLAHLRKLIEEDLELKNFQFLNVRDTNVPIKDEMNIAIGACLVNQDTIAVTDVVSPDLTASELVSDEFALVIWNNKDKKSLGACLVTKATTLRQLEERITSQDIEVPTGFVFMHRSVAIKPKQLDQFRVKHIMFKQEDGSDAIVIAEPDHY